MEQKQSYHTIKQLQLGQTEIEVCIETIPTEEQQKQRLIRIYDVVNEIADKANKRGIDTSKWFYTSKQIKKLKENSNNLFI